MKTRLGRQTRGSMFMRWFFFASAVIGCLILTTFTDRIFQVLGWVIIAAQDRDTPRMLMELMYAGMGAWGFINWLTN